MARQKDDYSTPEEQSSRSESTHVPGGLHSSTRKPAMDWEQPDFEELDLCMEVTTYIYHWQ